MAFGITIGETNTALCCTPSKCQGKKGERATMDEIVTNILKKSGIRIRNVGHWKIFKDNIQPSMRTHVNFVLPPEERRA
jgi:hypothetical protein